MSGGLIARARIIQQAAVIVDQALIQLLDKSVVFQLVLLHAAENADQHNEHADGREQKNSIENRLRLIDLVYAFGDGSERIHSQ